MVTRMNKRIDGERFVSGVIRDCLKYDHFVCLLLALFKKNFISKDSVILEVIA